MLADQVGPRDAAAIIDLQDGKASRCVHRLRQLLVCDVDHEFIQAERAAVVGLDGNGRRPIAERLSREPDSWTQFAGWSPDGRLAILGRGRESPENARWEEEHKQFRYNAEGWPARK